MAQNKIKITAKNFDLIDLDTLTPEELRTLCISLGSANRQLKETKARLKKDLNRQYDANRRTLPQASVLIGVLAEKCGMIGAPAVQMALEVVGEAPFKAEPVADLLPLDDGFAPVFSNKAGSYEMVAEASLTDIIRKIRYILDAGRLRGHEAQLVRALLNAVETRLDAAVADGFKTHNKTAPETYANSDVSITDAEQNLEYLVSLLTDMQVNLDFGMSILRTDLRARMYESIERGLRKASRIASELHREGHSNK